MYQNPPICRLYPGEAAGMVLVDAAHEDAGTIQGMPHRDPPPIPQSVIRGLSIVLGRLGMMRFLLNPTNLSYARRREVGPWNRTRSPESLAS